MVNTRRGNYQATSSEDVHEVPASKSTMHVVHASESSYRLENDEFVAESAAKGIEIAPSVFETHISKMDSNEQDNVLLARLLKKDFVSNVASAKSADPVILAHSQESSSSKEVFIPTPGFHHVASEELGPSRHSPLVRSLVSNDVTAPHPHSTPAPVPVDTFTETEGRIDVSNDETHV
ncbi:envelope-like protein [Cucumis melo var. makuwa]|nr:envelope-like protein [Cucumis melo var. makuwa]